MIILRTQHISKTVVFILVLCVLSVRVQGQRVRRPRLSEAQEQYLELLKQFNKQYDLARQDDRAAMTREERAAEQAALNALVGEYAPQFMAMALKDPEDSVGKQALSWLIARAPAGESFDTALDLVAGHYPGEAGLEAVCRRLFVSQSKNAEKFLETILDKTSHSSVRAAALTALAIRSKRQYEEGGDEALAKKSEEHFRRALNEFANLPRQQNTLVAKMMFAEARRKLEDLRGPLAIGKPAPEIEGEDLEGARFKLSDYRGKVVVLVFWNDW